MPPSHLVDYRLTPSRVVPYDPVWPEVFREVEFLVSAALPDLNVQHIGSTSIPSAYAKPIIDILIPCQRRRYPELVGELLGMGFQPTPFENIPAEKPMLVAGIKIREKFHNIHLHLAPEGSAVHLDNIAFRDALRGDPSLALEYGQIKNEAVSEGKLAPTEYNKAKAPFIRNVLRNAENSRNGEA
ncbi:GrpB family protein [Candidatus Sumerlaeota bacterium]|nr:GrpB family protein [Candidatus Sumerlaeota bacterium]